MMTQQERETLAQFLDQLTTAPAPQKVADADSLIRDAVAKQPDAAYLLVQRAMLLEQALNGAKAQIAQLQSQLQATQSGNGNSFLGSNPWAQPAHNAAPQGRVPGANQYQVPGSGNPFLPPQAGGAGSGFLGNMATTAAGVVAGSFLFQGIENMLGHHSSGWFSGGNFMGGPGDAAEETVINNYYDSAPADQSAQGSDDNTFLVSDGDDDSFAQEDSDDSSWV